jgi:signal transduction histidine kinase
MEQKFTDFAEKNIEKLGIFADSTIFWTLSIPDQKLLFISPNVEPLTGYKQSDFYLNPKLWLNLIQEYETPKPSRKLVGDKIIFESSYTIKDKREKELCVNEILIPILDANDNLIQIQVYSKINQQKTNSPEMINEITIPFFEAEFSNSEIKILKASKKFFELFNFSQDNFNSNDESLIHFLNLLSEKIYDLEFNHNSRLEFEISDDDGERIYLFEINLKEKNNDKIKFTAAGLDITELKLNQKRLQKLNNDKNKLLTIVSHDLKSPFNSILNFISLINDGIEIDEEQKREYLRFIYDSAKQQIELIHDLLDWSKVEAGLLEFTPHCINLNSIVNKIISGFGGQIYQKGLQIVSDFDKETKVFFDKNYLKIVLTNIISNAIKFSHKNGKIIISAKDEKDYTTIQIQDFGIGFSDRYLKQLTNQNNFEIQIGTMGEKGTGFGLKFCYDIIQSNHGKLMIETESQKGTKVIIKLKKPAVKIVYFDEELKLNEIKNHITKFQPEIYIYLTKDIFDLFNFIRDNSPDFVIINYDLIKAFQKSFIEKVFSELSETCKLIGLTSELNNKDELNDALKIYKLIDINKSKSFIISFTSFLFRQIKNGKGLKHIKFEHFSV